MEAVRGFRLHHYIMFSGLCQGFGLGFLFVPITTAAYSRITPEKMGAATGLFNLLRNEGGSVGIALSATGLSLRAQAHQTHLVGNLTPFHPLYREALSRIAAGLFPRAGLDPASVLRLSLGLLYGEVQRQSFVNAFVDVFWMQTLIFALILPFTFLLKGKPRGPFRRTDPGHGGMAGPG